MHARSRFSYAVEMEMAVVVAGLNRKAGQSPQNPRHHPPRSRKALADLAQATALPNRLLRIARGAEGDSLIEQGESFFAVLEYRFCFNALLPPYSLLSSHFEPA